MAGGIAPGGPVRARKASPCTAGGGVAVIGLSGFTILTFCAGAMVGPPPLLA